jgi:hypothetical protein
MHNRDTVNQKYSRLYKCEVRVRMCEFRVKSERAKSGNQCQARRNGAQFECECAERKSGERKSEFSLERECGVR